MEQPLLTEYNCWKNVRCCPLRKVFRRPVYERGVKSTTIAARNQILVYALAATVEILTHLSFRDSDVEMVQAGVASAVTRPRGRSASEQRQSLPVADGLGLRHGLKLPIPRRFCGTPNFAVRRV